eukprot:10881186-Ditylum_brightwellii.AAC.1
MESHINRHLLTCSKAISNHTTNNCNTISSNTSPLPIIPTHTTPIVLSMAMEKTSTTTTPTTIIVKVGTTESFIVGLMDAATTQFQIVSQNARS